MERIKWTNELIEIEIRRVMDALNLERMPSNSEINLIRESTDLANAITRRGGFYYWADRLNISIKDSESKTGDVYELYAMANLLSRGFISKRMSVRHPYDLLLNGHIKVDIKVSTAYWMRGKFLVNTVGLSKKYATCDLYIIYLLRESGELDRTLIIPSHEVKHRYLNIGKDSKYNKYVDRWDYIKIYDSVLKHLD